MTTFGPGVLKIGVTATAIDVSCLINGAKITASKDQGDSTYKLCGTVRPGVIRYSWEFTGNIDIDPEVSDGIFMLSQESAGTSVPFTFTPNTVGAVTATGNIIIDPLDFGGDDGSYGETMTSDFTWALDGKPVYSPTAPAEDAGELAAADA